MNKQLKSLLLLFILSGNVLAADISTTTVETRTLVDQAKNKLAQAGARVASIVHHPLGMAWTAVGILVASELIRKYRMPQSALVVVPNGTQAKVTFEDLSGMQPQKDTLLEQVIWPVKHPDIARQYGLRPANGILLYGPPGCGKTYLARAIAQEIGCESIEIDMAKIGSPFIHETSVKLAKIFEDAEKDKQWRVIFIDEYESLVPDRRYNIRPDDNAKNEEVTTILKLIEKCTLENIIFIGATNHREKIDTAALRSGRLDIQLKVEAPSEDARQDLFQRYLAQRGSQGVHCASIDFADLAKKTDGYTCADIKTIVDTVTRKTVFQAFQAIRAQIAGTATPLPLVTMNDMQQAIESHRQNIQARESKRPVNIQENNQAMDMQALMRFLSGFLGSTSANNQPV